MKAAALERTEVTALSPEDAGRADFYALLAALYFAPPNAELLSLLAATAPAGEPDSPLYMAWEALGEAARETDPERVADEFARLFAGPGRPPVMVYGSHHRTGFLMDTPLVELREHLAELGLGRKEGVGESEDHMAGLCDVMRLLIAGAEGIAPATLEQQQEFFNRHIGPWYRSLARELTACDEADFYRRVGRFTEAFLDVEASSFNIGS